MLSDPHFAASVPSAAGLGWCPLVLGECVQGRLESDRHFLITSPIGLFSWAEYTCEPGLGRVLSEPANRSKSREAVRRYLEREGLPASGRLRVFTPLDPGQGFGTSTADITASVRAAAAAWGREVSCEALARLAIEIEPSDGSMFPDCVAFAHREGVLLESLGPLPRFEALVACTGGVIDTVEFDARRKDFRYSARDQHDLLSAWHMVRHANRTRDAALMALASTISARINEQLLRKPYFDEILRFVELSGVEGVMAAHSGTALALVLDPARPGYHQRLLEARRFLERLELPAWFQISNTSLTLRDERATLRPPFAAPVAAERSAGGADVHTHAL